MSQSPALSFGPSWMRPKPSRHSSQDITPRANSNLNRAWDSSAVGNSLLNEQEFHVTNDISNNFGASPDQYPFQPTFLQLKDVTSSDTNTSKPNRVYSIDELNQIWSSIQDELQMKGYDEKYRSLAPIRQLIDQVEKDRQMQKQYQQQQSGAKRYDNSSAQVSQLNDKLKEFGNWAKTESSLDFSSILSKVASSSNLINSNIGMKSNSPFANKPMLHRESSFQSIHSPMLSHRSVSQSNFQPLSTPTIPQAQYNNPSEALWYYVDTSGNQQGPFAGDAMQSWFDNGYFTPTLNLRRAEEINYRTLEDLMTLVNDFEKPFLKPTPSQIQPMAAPIATTPSFSTFNQFDTFSSQPMYQTSSTFMSPLVPQPQISQLQQSQQIGWASQSGRASPWASNHNDFNANEFRLGAHSPFMASSNSTSFLNDNSNSILNQPQDQPQAVYKNISQEGYGSLSNDDGLLERINSRIFENSFVENTIIDSNIEKPVPVSLSPPEIIPEADVIQKTSSATQKQDANPSPPVKTKKKAHVVTQASVTAPAPAFAPASTQAPVSSMQEALAEAKEAAKVEARSLSTRTSVSKGRAEKKDVKKLVSESSKAESEPIKNKPQLAPWANKTSQNDKPQLTLEQIQVLEAKESAKQSKIKAEKDKIIAAQLFAAAERESELANQKLASLPVTSSWGKPAANVAAPAKTLLDIQREEAEAEAKSAALAAKLAANNAKVPLAAAPPKNSFASIITPQNTNPWTTVTAKKPAPAKPVIKAPQTSSAKINPDVLRNVSASAPKPVNPHSNVNSKVSPRQEFLTWCRSSMKLNRGINENEVLQILLMLPLGSESQEIIADTIYCNSTTMDGRRFAQEFLKKRKFVEDGVNDGLSWDDALLMTVEDDNDGWDFQVVGKKGKRRN